MQPLREAGKLSKVKTAAMKASLLLQLRAGGHSLGDFHSAEYTLDQSGSRILNALTEYLMQELARADVLHAAFVLRRSLQRSIGWHDDPLAGVRQLEGIGPALAQKLHSASAGSLEALATQVPSRIELVCGKASPFGNQCVRAARSLLAKAPLIVADVGEITQLGEHVPLVVRLVRRSDHDQPSGSGPLPSTHGGYGTAWLLLVSDHQQKVLLIRRLAEYQMDQQHELSFEITVPPESARAALTATLVHVKLFGLDSTITIRMPFATETTAASTSAAPCATSSSAQATSRQPAKKTANGKKPQPQPTRPAAPPSAPSSTSAAVAAVLGGRIGRASVNLLQAAWESSEEEEEIDPIAAADRVQGGSSTTVNPSSMSQEPRIAMDCGPTGTDMEAAEDAALFGESPPSQRPPSNRQPADRMRGDSAPSTRGPPIIPCGHHCLNKATCQHECCKTGVLTAKRRRPANDRADEATGPAKSVPKVSLNAGANNVDDEAFWDQFRATPQSRPRLSASSCQSSRQSGSVGGGSGGGGTSTGAFAGLPDSLSSRRMSSSGDRGEPTDPGTIARPAAIGSMSGVAGGRSSTSVLMNRMQAKMSTVPSTPVRRLPVEPLSHQPLSAASNSNPPRSSAWGRGNHGSGGSGGRSSSMGGGLTTGNTDEDAAFEATRSNGPLGTSSRVPQTSGHAEVHGGAQQQSATALAHEQHQQLRSQLMGQQASVAEGTPRNGGWSSSQTTSASNPRPPVPHQAATSPASDFLMGLELPSPASASICHVERDRASDGARGALLAQSTARPAWAPRPPLSALSSKNEPLAPLMQRHCAPPGVQSAHHFANDHAAVSASSNNVPISVRSSAPLLFGSLPRMGSTLSLEGRSGRMLSAGIHGAASQSGGRFPSGWPDSSDAPTGVKLSARASGASINPIGRTAVAAAPGGRGEVAAAPSSRGLVSAVDDWLDSLEAKPPATKTKKDAKKDVHTSVAPRSMVNVFGSAASGRTPLSQPVDTPAPRTRGPFGI